MPTNGRSDIFDGNSSLAFNEESDFVKKLMRSNGIYNKYEEDFFNRFSRIGIIDPYNALTNTKEYIFMTKPDLCLMIGNKVAGPLQKNPFFIDAIDRYREAAKQLQTYGNESSGPFITMVSNSVTSSLDLPGLSSDTIETGGNTMGTRIKYRSTSHKSDENHDFSLEFEDTKYLDVYMLFKMWDEYEKLKWAGVLDFSRYGLTHWEDYIINKVLHDQVSVYKFVVDEDGSRVVYFARLTGVVPTSIPRDAFSDMTSHDSQKITVGFTSHFVRDMDPIIIEHFNAIVEKGYGKFGDSMILPLFDQSIHTFNGEWARCPHIRKRVVSNGYRGSRTEYFLEWYRGGDPRYTRQHGGLNGTF